MKEEKLYALIDQELQGILPQGDQATLEQWLGQDRTHRTQYEEIKTIMAVTSDSLNTIPTDSADQWAQLSASLELAVEEEEMPGIPMRTTSTKRWWGIAAAVVLLAIVGFWAINQGNTGPDGKGNAIASVVETQRGEVQVFELPDGSRVHLNADSRLSLAEGFNDKDRRVMLEGEGYFDIAHNPEKPFVITSGNATTRVLGTEFNLCAYANQKAVVLEVTEGKVEFGVEGTEVKGVFEKGSGAMIDGEGKMWPMEKEMMSAAEWRTGKLVFRQTPLRDAVVRMEKHYDLEFSVDPEVEDISLVATYDVKAIDAESLIDNLRTTLDLDIQFDGHRVSIAKK